MTVIDRIAGVLERRTSRRGFLVKSTLVGTALAVGPVEFLLKPTTAYAAICRCGNPACGCNSPCCDGYTEFCCTLTGSNVCPSGSFAGGWWKADGSTFCAGPRYYIDCHAECNCTDGCQPGGQSFCAPGCDGVTCGCADGRCTSRVSGCVSFRYGQCHEEVACAGRILCRVVTCTPAYLFDNGCSTASMTDENTRQHNAPCLEAPAHVARAYGFGVRPAGGAWAAGRAGDIYGFGDAHFYGRITVQLDQPIVGLASAPGSDGYWLVASDGGVFCFGNAPFWGSTGGIRLNSPVVGMAPTPDGQGYWLVASDGGVFCFGNATFFGSTGGVPLVSPIVSMTLTHDATGYWLVAADGGVFAFGSAVFHGSRGANDNNSLMGGLVATPSGQGYWLWGQDGTVYPFGDAGFFGDYHTPGAAQQPGMAPLRGGGVDSFYGMVAAPDGAGYGLWALASLGPPATAQEYLFGSLATPPPPPPPAPPPSPLPLPLPIL